MADAAELLGTIQSGSLTYNRVRQNGDEFAVLDGKTLNDRADVFAIKFDKSSGDEYFVNVLTLDKSWTLPENTSLQPEVTAVVPEEILQNPWRARFIAFYEKYSPDRIPFIDPTLLQYPGQEAILMKSLVRKYGPEPGHEEEYAAALNDVSSSMGGTKDVGQFRQRVVDIISHYKPSKLPLVDKYMGKYAGQEEELIQFLVNKFGPEPETAAVSAMSVDTSLADKGVLLRESALMGFLQDREARLEVALNRNADLTAELTALREQNEGLLKEARDLRGAVDSESKRVEGDLQRVRNANIVAAQHWEVEKASLTAQLQSEASAAQQVLIAERLKFQQVCADHYKEKGLLLEESQRNKEELGFCQRKTSELLEALDRKEVSILRLQKEHEGVLERLTAARVTSSSQTAGEDISDLSPFALQTPSQRQATEALQHRIAVLEATIQQIRFDCQQHSHLSQQLQHKGRVLDSLTSSPFSFVSVPASPVTLSTKLSNAHATISALRTMNAAHEERIAMLEMQLLSKPQQAASQCDTLDAERLAATEATVKSQRREIADLRGLLARYMSVQKKQSSIAQ